jgi:hypothetical protein
VVFGLSNVKTLDKTLDSSLDAFVPCSSNFEGCLKASSALVSTTRLFCIIDMELNRSLMGQLRQLLSLRSGVRCWESESSHCGEVVLGGQAESESYDDEQCRSDSLATLCECIKSDKKGNINMKHGKFG